MQFLGAFEVRVVVEEFTLVKVQLHVVVLVWGERRRVELVLATEELNIQKFID